MGQVLEGYGVNDQAKALHYELEQRGESPDEVLSVEYKGKTMSFKEFESLDTIPWDSATFFGKKWVAIGYWDVALGCVNWASWNSLQEYKDWASEARKANETVLGGANGTLHEFANPSRGNGEAGKPGSSKPRNIKQ